MQTDALFHYGKYCKSAKWCYHGRSCDYEMATPFHLIDMTFGHFYKMKTEKVPLNSILLAVTKILLSLA